MLWAYNPDGEKVTATPKARGACPFCDSVTIAKCGSKKIWHWAHISSAPECDSWAEGETEWHRSWKLLVVKDNCEVTRVHDGVRHRADIVGNNDTVIELQHSNISLEGIRSRETFYGNMIWVFDAADFFGNILFKPKNDIFTIAWYFSRMILSSTTRPVFLHLPCGNLFELKKVHPKSEGQPVRGWGRYVEWNQFFSRYLSSVVKLEYSNGAIPGLIRNRSDVKFDKLKFHHNLEIHGVLTYSHQEYNEWGNDYWESGHSFDKPIVRCNCGRASDFPNCSKVMKNADIDYIGKVCGD